MEHAKSEDLKIFYDHQQILRILNCKLQNIFGLIDVKYPVLLAEASEHHQRGV